MQRRLLLAASALFIATASSGLSAQVQKALMPDPALRAPAIATPDRSTRVIGVGSGWIAGPGQVVTADHVVEHCRRIEVESHAGARHGAGLVSRDPGRDVALLHAASLPRVGAIAMARLSARPGEAVRVVGFPAYQTLGTGAPGAEPATVQGRVITRDTNSAGFPRLALETRLDFGSSGSVVIDREGRAVGMAVGMLNTARYRARSGQDVPPIGFAVPAGVLRALLPRAALRPASLSGEMPSLEQIERRVVRVICHG